MKTTSTRSNGPRELDRRTREGRVYFGRLGKKGFAKARRTWKRTGKLPPSMEPTPEAPPAVKAKPYDWSRGIAPTLPQLEADIAYREDFLKKLHGLRDIMSAMQANIDRIAAG